MTINDNIIENKNRNNDKRDSRKLGKLWPWTVGMAQCDPYQGYCFIEFIWKIIFKDKGCSPSKVL